MTAVTYRYGGSTDELYGEIVISKGDTPVHEPLTHLESAIVARILRRLRADGVWPSGGGVQH